jgi:serine/threonine-protein kinase
VTLPFHVREALRRAAAGAVLSDADRTTLAALAERGNAPAPADTFAGFGADPPPVSAPAEADAPLGIPIEGTRFLHRGPLGSGGMGEVLRVLDPRLAREVALKVMHPHLAIHAAYRDRFVEEAQIQARLQHPNLVPVHELGVLPDGRPWFAMEIIRGERVHAVIGRVHAASLGAWAADEDGWTLHRLVSTLLQACRAVGYAHGLGIVHRDLKPQNLMVGAFGEVRVVDWGLARALASPETADPRSGSVSGTPAYLAPEQASDGMIDARTDVYALGTILYEMLSGHAPYGSPEHPSGRSAEDVLAQLRAGPPRSVQTVTALPVPDELAAIVTRAMERLAPRRYADANALAEAIETWLDGSRREEIARDMVRRAERTRVQAQAHRRHAAQLRTSAEKALASVPRWADAGEKAEAWAMEDRAAALEREADLLDARRVQAFEAALSHAPASQEAHAALIAHHREQLAAAEARLDAPGADRAALHLRQHVEGLLPSDPQRAAMLRWLDGGAALTLHGSPATTAFLDRYVLRDRRLVPSPERQLGPLPLREVPLPMGRWRLRLRTGASELAYPLHIERAQPWNDIHPHTGAPAPFMPPDLLADDECFVPGGWFIAGGDDRAPGTPLSRRRVWVDDVVVSRFPVTHGQYIRFLDALVAEGREADALRHAPRLMGAAPGEQGPLLYGYDGTGFALPTGGDAAIWTADTPVVLVDWSGACAYAVWWAGRTGQPWRLLDEFEWEKAARGVDGRLHPWGDAFDPSWCAMRDSQAKPRPATVNEFPADESVYGVRGMAGNVLDWTATAYVPDGRVPDGGALELLPDDGRGRRVARGGSWNDAASSTRCATRYNIDPAIRLNFVGFRLARTPA